LLYEETSFKGDALTNLTIIQKMDIKIICLDENKLDKFVSDMDACGVIIDAIFGTGFKGALDSQTTKIIEAINQFHRKVISVDIPSGLQIENNCLKGTCVKAAKTVCLGLPKTVEMHEACRDVIGELLVVDIGIPENIIRKKLK